jgi:hypothetical protein
LTVLTLLRTSHFSQPIEGVSHLIFHRCNSSQRHCPASSTQSFSYQNKKFHDFCKEITVILENVLDVDVGYCELLPSKQVNAEEQFHHSFHEDATVTTRDDNADLLLMQAQCNKEQPLSSTD